MPHSPPSSCLRKQWAKIVSCTFTHSHFINLVRASIYTLRSTRPDQHALVRNQPRAAPHLIIIINIITNQVIPLFSFQIHRCTFICINTSFVSVFFYYSILSISVSLYIRPTPPNTCPSFFLTLPFSTSTLLHTFHARHQFLHV